MYFFHFAGKTESTKYIVQQIAQLCNQDHSDLHERIVMVIMNIHSAYN